ncbi:uncharacterized protein [Miscanthus floridulus]|uniref:uncharacterized protein n=1 Tax=Miscanthus floridulus TaxID=154761 RepID=UPI0034583F88
MATGRWEGHLAPILPISGVGGHLSKLDQNMPLLKQRVAFLDIARICELFVLQQKRKMTIQLKPWMNHMAGTGGRCFFWHVLMLCPPSRQCVQGLAKALYHFLELILFEVV